MSKPRYYFLDDSGKAGFDFSALGFNYVPCPYRFEAVFKHGIWRVRGVVEDEVLHVHEGSHSLHYGQQLFEGMKVYTGADGKFYAFRPTLNAERINQGANYLCGPIVPQELFLRAIEEVTQANAPYVPPFGSGASLYLRPMYIGVGANVGVKPASEYIFRVFVTPVGPYFKGGFGPAQGKSFCVSKHDRAAPFGTGHIKTGGNYACSFLPGIKAKSEGYAEALYLDPAEHKYIDEIGAANFLGIVNDTIVTPKSSSVLPSVTRRSLMHLAKEVFHWPTQERRIALEELSEFQAAACCGTAAVITWIDRIVDGERSWTFPFDERWQKLYDELVGIQTATRPDPFGWRYEIPAG